MTVVYPEGTPTLGNTKVVAAVAVADMEAPSLATEIDAGTSVDMSCFLLNNGWNPDATTAKGTKQPRLCSKTQQEQLNRTTWTIPDLMYSYNPQEDDTDPDNAAKALLTEGTRVYFVERRGLDAQDDAMAVGDRTRTFLLELGPQIDSGDLTDENGEYYIKQSAVLLGEAPVRGVVVA